MKGMINDIYLIFLLLVRIPFTGFNTKKKPNNNNIPVVCTELKVHCIDKRPAHALMLLFEYVMVIVNRLIVV